VVFRRGVEENDRAADDRESRGSVVRRVGSNDIFVNMIDERTIRCIQFCLYTTILGLMFEYGDHHDITQLIGE
jgi:hypothetical protein